MSATKKRNYNDLLIWSAAAVTIVRYSAAFISSDVGKIEGWISDIIVIGMGISGLGMGLLDVVGGMTLFQGWRTAIPRAGAKSWSIKFWALTILVFGLIINGIVIVVPFTVSRVLHESMDSVLGRELGLWLWAIAVNIAPYMLIGGIAVSNNVVQTDTSANGANGSRTDPRTLGKTYESLSPSEKRFIANTLPNSAETSKAAAELGVTPRAIQKWRKAIMIEIEQGKL